MGLYLATGTISTQFAPAGCGPVIADFDNNGTLDVFFVAGKGTSDKTRSENYGRAFALPLGRGKGEMVDVSWEFAANWCQMTFHCMTRGSSQYYLEPFDGKHKPSLRVNSGFVL